MTYTPVKTVVVTPGQDPTYATCSGCPGYVIHVAHEAEHIAWHALVGTDPTPPPPPSPPPKPVNQVINLTASATQQGQVLVSWKAPAVGMPASYVVARDGVEAGGGSPNWSGSIGGAATAQLFTNLAPGTKYTFTITPAGGVPLSVSCTTLVASPTPTPPAGNGYGAAAPLGSAGTWALDFTDDFNGPLDSKKWMWDQRPDGGVTGWGTDEWYDASAVSVANSCLVLTMSHQAGNGRALKSGVVSTGPSSGGARYSFKPGSFMEIRSKVPPASDGDLWPAWWGISIKGWPPEQDWYEFGYGGGPMGDTQGKPVTTWHYQGGNGPTSKTGGSYGTGDLRGAWHTYGVHWSTDGKTLTMYVDGQQYLTYDMTVAPNNQWQIPQVIIFSHQCQNANIKDGSQYLIDWINVWTPA